MSPPSKSLPTDPTWNNIKFAELGLNGDVCRPGKTLYGRNETPEAGEEAGQGLRGAGASPVHSKHYSCI